MVLWCLAALAVGFAISYGRLSETAGTWLYLLSALLLGLEGQSFASAALERARFAFVDIAAGPDRLAAERSFFSRWLVAAPTPAAGRPSAPMAPAHVIGLFPESGG